MQRKTLARTGIGVGGQSVLVISTVAIRIDNDYYIVKLQPLKPTPAVQVR